MDKIKIKGGKVLSGKIYISGAKNAALPLICASLLTDEPVILRNMPVLSDIKAMNKLLEHLGVKIEESEEFTDGHNAKIYSYFPRRLKNFKGPYDYIRKMRASYYILGPLLSHFGKCELSLPGGCAIGARPIDIHLSSLEKMGAEIKIENGYIYARSKGRLKGAQIIFPKVSVGATCNVLMAAVLARGKTLLENVAKEPEIGDLAGMLNDMGAKITGIGTNVLTIEGVEKLHGTKHKIIADRVEAGSYAVAAAITHGRLELVNADSETLLCPLQVLKDMGAKIDIKKNSIIIDARGCRLVGKDIMTEPFPGFPTDLQAQFLALMTIAKGASLVTETIFENRFMHIPELVRMGANINVHGHGSAIIRGVGKLSGAPVMATDLRASFALILAGLVAKGETIVNRVYHLDRGYEKLEEKLKSVGADIKRIKDE